MYCAKVRASLPEVTDLPATLPEGIDTFVRPAFAASALIADGVMSGDPTICSCFRVSCTVLYPEIPRASDPAPNKISTAPATNPPIFSHFLIVPLLSLRIWREAPTPVDVQE